MLEVYTRSYYGKIRTDVIYYFYINVRGTKKYYQTIYEMVSDFSYEFSRYEITLNGEIRNIGKIENDMIKYTPLLFSNIKAQRRLAVLSKFALYLISEINSIPIYKLPRNVTYYHNGIELTLSQNAFVKSTYELIPRFEKIYHQF
jgi:hypothetical protein